MWWCGGVSSRRNKRPLNKQFPTSAPNLALIKFHKPKTEAPYSSLNSEANTKTLLNHVLWGSHLNFANC